MNLGSSFEVQSKFECWGASCPTLQKAWDIGHRIVDELAIGIWIVPKEGNLGALFNLLKEEFGGVCRRIWVAKCTVVAFKRGWSGFAIVVHQLIEYGHNRHLCMPSLDGGVIQHLKSVVDACIDGCKAGPFDVYHQHVVIFATRERCVNGGLLSP
jgi:hypothetical protein